MSSASVLDLQQELAPSTERCNKRTAKQIVKPNRHEKSAKITSMEKTPEDSAMRRAHVAVALTGVVFCLCAVSFFGVRAGLSVLAGAAIASINLLVLARTVTKMVEGAGASWAGVALIKFLVLMAVTYGFIDSGIVEPLGLAVGFGALPFGILLATTFGHAPEGERVEIETNVKSDHA